MVFWMLLLGFLVKQTKGACVGAVFVVEDHNASEARSLLKAKKADMKRPGFLLAEAHAPKSAKIVANEIAIVTTRSSVETIVATPSHRFRLVRFGSPGLLMLSPPFGVMECLRSMISYQCQFCFGGGFLGRITG